MATEGPILNLNHHRLTRSPQPGQLLVSSSCHVLPPEDYRASRRDSASSGTKALSTAKSAPQLTVTLHEFEEGEEIEKEVVDSTHGRRTNLKSLPEETQEAILEHLVGNLSSISSSAGVRNGTRNWNNAMRHPRARELTNLALVSPLWRHMIQQRLYRHSKYTLHVSV